MKVDKSKEYDVVFVHCLDDEDMIQIQTLGKLFFRHRNLMRDCGYQVKTMKEFKK